MVLIFRLGSDVSWLGQPPPEVGRPSQWPWEPGKVGSDRHTSSMPARPPGQAGQEDTSPSPGASRRHLNCPGSLVPTHPCMTRPPYLGAKPVSTCPHPSARAPVSVDPLGQGGLFATAPAGRWVVQAGGRAGWACGNFRPDSRGATECEGKPEATPAGRTLDREGGPRGRQGWEAAQGQAWDGICGRGPAQDA